MIFLKSIEQLIAVIVEKIVYSLPKIFFSRQNAPRFSSPLTPFFPANQHVIFFARGQDGRCSCQKERGHCLSKLVQDWIYHLASVIFVSFMRKLCTQVSIILPSKEANHIEG